MPSTHLKEVLGHQPASEIIYVSEWENFIDRIGVVSEVVSENVQRLWDATQAGNIRNTIIESFSLAEMKSSWTDLLSDAMDWNASWAERGLFIGVLKLIRSQGNGLLPTTRVLSDIILLEEASECFATQPHSIEPERLCDYSLLDPIATVFNECLYDMTVLPQAAAQIRSMFTGMTRLRDEAVAAVLESVDILKRVHPAFSGELDASLEYMIGQGRS